MEFPGAEWTESLPASTLATSWSVAKSFTSAMIGIAIDSGALAGIDVPVSDLITCWKGTPKEDITIRALLEMRSGLDWDEGASSTLYYIAEDDQVAAALDLDVVGVLFASVVDPHTAGSAERSVLGAGPAYAADLRDPESGPGRCSKRLVPARGR